MCTAPVYRHCTVATCVIIVYLRYHLVLKFGNYKGPIWLLFTRDKIRQSSHKWCTNSALSGQYLNNCHFWWSCSAYVPATLWWYCSRHIHFWPREPRFWGPSQNHTTRNTSVYHLPTNHTQILPLQPPTARNNPTSVVACNWPRFTQWPTSTLFVPIAPKPPTHRKTPLPLHQRYHHRNRLFWSKQYTCTDLH